jgi:hypothetical protein
MYREVTMLEVKEVLRLWREGVPTKGIAAQVGLDPKTVRRYLGAATAAGLRAEGTEVSEEQLREVLLALQPAGGRPRSDGWTRCEAQRDTIRRWLGEGFRLTKIRKLLDRQGVAIAYPTLYRFAVLELQFGQTATTIPVVDGDPGQDYGESRVMESGRRRSRICTRSPPDHPSGLYITTYSDSSQAIRLDGRWEPRGETVAGLPVVASAARFISRSDWT